ncbi:membrane protein [Verrucomicrobiota bacterium]|nr:membrane protein [Verrucomicrobiota bacterium]
MPPEVPTHPLVWVGFVVFILALLALDLGVFHRKAHVVSFREALGWSVAWMTLALAFGIGLIPTRGREDALEFVTGYLIEMSLSMDNVFVIALVFAYFRVPNEYQHRVLFWGILGAMVMRGAMIGTGVVLIHRFHWMLYVFGGFLVFTGLKMMVVDDEGVHPERNPILRLARRFFPVTTEFEGDRFLTRINGRRALTPLALVLLLVETTDLIFALDSIPAIFAVTQKGFIIFTSNVFAMLGLRSLYFLLAGAIAAFRYLKIGLSLVLIFIGARMLLPLVAARVPALAGVTVSTAVSLGVVAVILLISVGVSILMARRDQKSPPTA